MIICFQCTRSTKENLDRLVGLGSYADYSEALEAAVRNLLLITEEVHRGGAIVMREAEPRYSVDGSQRSRRPDPPAQDLPLQPATAPDAAASARASTSVAAASPIPPLLRAVSTTADDLLVAELPDDVWIRGQSVPIDRWIFGQYNRVLPAKASCRALANMLLSSAEGVPLSQAVVTIAEQAAQLGDYLSAVDADLKRPRDDLYSTAFPCSGEDAAKSRLRYGTQFVASVNSTGQLSGLLVDLKLINYKGRKDPLLRLTRIGAEFGTAWNPVLDGELSRDGQKLSEEERDMLLSHIENHVPAEHFAYTVILKALMAGSDAPQALDAELRRLAPTNDGLSDSFLYSQRSGAVSRMCDLGLVVREREGARVRYHATERGELYASR